MAHRIVYFGTPDFSVPFLDALVESKYEVPLVVTQPDKPIGRSKKLVPSPVSEYAREHGIPVIKPETLKDDQVVDQLRSVDADCYVVVVYGSILPKTILTIPPKQTINFHPSLLPKYRGASPMEHTILNGESESGVTIMLLDEGMDTGPVLTQTPVPVDDTETLFTLRDKLVEKGCKEMISSLAAWLSDEITPQPQNESEATTTPLLKKSDGAIDWSMHDAVTLERMIRAFVRWPTVFTSWNSKQLKILSAHIASETSDSLNSSAGDVVAMPDGVGIVTQAGTLILDDVQMEGSKPQHIKEFMNGHQSFVGSKLA